MKTTSRIIGLAILFTALMAAPAVAQSPTEGHHDHEAHADGLDDDTAFDQMVRGIHTLPDRQIVEERWPDITERLIDRATDPEATEYERWRATSLLGNFQEPDVERALLELTGEELRRVRGMAYFVLGAAFLDEGDDELFETLKEGLEDSERQVRERVLRSFRWTDHEGALELLEDFARGERGDENLQGVAEHTLKYRD